MDPLLSAPTAIFLHGGPGMREYLEESFAGPMKRAGAIPIFYPQLKSSNLSDLIEQLGAVIRGVPSERVFLVGHSWGGLLAAHFLKARPDPKVLGVVFMNVPLSSDFDAGYANEMKRRGIDQPSAEQLFLSETESKDTHALEFLEEVLRSTDQAYLDDVYRAFVGSSDMRPFLSMLDLPALFVIGEQDSRVPPKCQFEYAALVKGARIFRIPDAGHFSYLLHVESAVQTLKKFFDEV